MIIGGYLEDVRGKVIKAKNDNPENSVLAQIFQKISEDGPRTWKALLHKYGRDLLKATEEALSRVGIAQSGAKGSVLFLNPRSIQDAQASVRADLNSKEDPSSMPVERAALLALASVVA